MSTIQEQPGDKGEFLRQLPQRMAAIEENWTSLKHQNWNAELLETLYGRVREISEASSRFELFQLSENVFSVEIYLSSFAGVEERPSQEQVDSIEGLLRNLRSAAKSCADSHKPRDTAGKTEVIYLLGDPADAVMQHMSAAFEALETKTKTFTEPAALNKALDSKTPLAIVVNTSVLPRMAALSAELVRLRSQESLNLPVTFISTSSALQLRVDAIRAGGEAYFVVPADYREIATQVLRSALPEKGKAYRILVVEDDPTQADFAASILRKADMQAMTCTEPMRVLDVMRSFRPDLILMDIYMPEVNGLELTTVIREHDEFVGIPIVFLSGEQNTERQLDALSVGGDDFVIKPIRPRHLLAIVQNRVRRSRRLLDALGERAPHDRLTGLLSKQQFTEQIDRALETAENHPQEGGVLVIAPDHLDTLVKTLGVGGVDHLVAELARVIRAPLHNTDAAARLDGHTLGILVRRETRKEIEQLADKLHSQVSQQRFVVGGEAVPLGISIGTCLFEHRDEDHSGLLHRAQSAMQQASTAGDNQTHVYQKSGGSRPSPTSNDDIIGLVNDCLANDRFAVRYQPMLDLQSRGTENYEVLLKVPTPSGDLLQERSVREAAGQSTLATQIDQWLLEKAISVLKQRREDGRQAHLFVHQSLSSMRDPNHPAWLLGRLRSQHMVGTGLVLDFSLPDLSNDIKGGQKLINELHELDVQVCLSRFPEKAAAFKVLRFVQADYISVAPRLLRADRKIIAEVIGETHKAGAKVIVPNIDDARSIDLHWSSGADYLQGNFIQRPLESMDYDFSQVVI